MVGGPVVVPWPVDEALAETSDGLDGPRATSVCIIPWGEPAFLTAWLRAHVDDPLDYYDLLHDFTRVVLLE
jgi:hypothetical protein